MAISINQNCDASRKEYLGNGVGRDFLIDFEYYERSDIGVANWNTVTLNWDAVPSANNWFFLNDGSIRFNTAPAYNQKFIIYRHTDVDSLPAEFTPGTPIKAAELNTNFDVLRYAVEELRCTDQVGTGSSILDTIKTVQQVDGSVASQNLLDDNTVFTSAAVAARHDNIVSDTKPTVVTVEQPGKIWNDTDSLVDYFWDPDGQVWVSFTKSGPPGAVGNYGPPGKVICSDTPPIQYPALTGNTARPLESGDLWFDTANALLYIYYVDSVSSQWVTISKTPNVSTKADIDSPTFTGTPSAPTATTGTSTTQIATTEFVSNSVAVNVSNIATNTSNIATNTSNIATNTSDIATNTSDIATNTSDIATNTSDIATNTSDIATKMPIAGGTFTGLVTLSGAPTANLHAATKQYVDDNAGGGLQSSDIGVTVQAYDADNAVTDAAQTFTAAQRGTITTLTSGATVTPDFAASNNYSLTLDQNLTIDNPTNLTAGQSGSIFLVQDGTGSRVASWGSYWDFAGGTAPTLTAGVGGAVDRIDYVVRSSTSIHAVATLNYS
jgi:hypothetical protein